MFNPLWLFSVPPQVTDREMRKAGLIAAGAGLLALVIGFAVMAWAVNHDRAVQTQIAQAAQQTGGDFKSIAGGVIMILVLPVSVGYLFFVAGVYRILLGVPGPNGFVRFLRGCFALALFLFTFMASLVLYGQISP